MDDDDRPAALQRQPVPCPFVSARLAEPQQRRAVCNPPACSPVPTRVRPGGPTLRFGTASRSVAGFVSLRGSSPLPRTAGRTTPCARWQRRGRAAGRSSVIRRRRNCTAFRHSSSPLGHASRCRRGLPCGRWPTVTFTARALLRPRSRDGAEHHSPTCPAPSSTWRASTVSMRGSLPPTRPCGVVSRTRRISSRRSTGATAGRAALPRSEWCSSATVGRSRSSNRSVACEFPTQACRRRSSKRRSATRRDASSPASDFYWPEYGVAGEADGNLKYDAGRNAIVAERRRQQRLEDLGLVFVRWEWSDLGRFEVVARRIRTAFTRGIPRGHGQRWSLL